MNMRKIIILLLLSAGVIPAAVACDICGCGAGSYYIGILPEFNSRIIGLRYRASYLQTHIGPGGTSSYLTTDEHYRTAELWGGWTFKDKFRVMAYLPVSFNSKTNQEENLSKAGLGDAAVQGFYRLLNKRKATGKEGTKLFIQDLWIGGGIKLPTGKYEPADKEASGKSANLFQLGTGSFDFVLTAMYDLRFQDAGLNITGSYKINTGNKYDYAYGNKFSGSAQLYHKFRIRQALTLSPNAGASYETSARDLDDSYAVYTSGGYILFGTLGAELSYRKIAVGGNWQPVFSQDLAQGAVKAHNKMMLHVSFMF
jgi:hypothetical protein